MFLSLETMFAYLGASPNSQCIRGGESVLNAKYMVAHGIVKHRGNFIKLFAICLRTSAPDDNPHEIYASLDLTDKVKITTASCSCRAGQSGKCKHVVALLMLCTRSDIEKFEKFSSSNVKRYLKAKENGEFLEDAAVPITEMCECIPKSNVHLKPLTEDQANAIRDAFVKAMPNSLLAQHINRGKNANIDSSSADSSK